MGRLRRNKTVGLFPSNYVEVLENYQRPGIHSRPVSRAASPSMLSPQNGRKSRAASPASSTRSRVASPQPPRHRSRSPQPPRHRSRSPHPPRHGDYDDGRGDGSSRSRTGRSRSPASYHHESLPRVASPNLYNRAVSPNPYNRAASPNPYNRAVSPAPSFGGYGMPRAVSPAPSHFRAISPSPSMRQYQRSASPIPYMNDHHVETAPPPAPPPHRVNRRAVSPLPPQQDGRLTPIGSRAPTPNGQTPSPLRNAMEDVMESLQHMTSHDHDDRPRTPAAPWSPESFSEIYTPSPKKHYVRPETSLGIAGRNEYEEDEDALYPKDNYADRMEDQLRRFQLTRGASQRRVSDDDVPPPTPPKFSSYGERPRTGDPIRSRKSAYDLRASAGSASPTKMIRPRPLSRMATLSSNSTSNQSSSTNTTHSTALTSASLMSGMSAGGLSATSAGSLARRKHKSISVIEGSGILGSISPRLGGTFGSRSETPSGCYSSGSGSGSVSGPLGRKRGQTWNSTSANSSSPGVFGGLAAPKPKKSSFFKKILNSAKTSAASVRSVAESPVQVPAQFAPKTIPDGVTAIAGGRAYAQPHSQDWVHVRRDVNRANTLSKNERIERQEKQQMMNQPVLRPVDALEEDVDGNEAADDSIVENPQDFDTANLSLVDKAARFVGNLPPFTTPESLATHHVCRPYRSDVQRLRAIFTWVSEKIAWEHPSGPIDGEYEPEDVDPRRVLSQKRGSPEEIAVVVQRMCAAVGIHCDIIRGFLKTPGEALDIESCPRPNHWWNAMVVDGEWRFMDCSLASPTHPRRFMYSHAPPNQAEFFYFLAKPNEFCWTHVPLAMEQQHLVPPLPLPILLALPCACPTFFRQGLRMINFDTSLTRLENLEVVQIEFSVPMGVECIAEVEAKGFAIDQDGDVFETGEVVKKRALAQAVWENGVKTYRVKAVLPGDEGQGVLKVYAGKRGLMVGPTHSLLACHRH